jgi:hypothetical protein
MFYDRRRNRCPFNTGGCLIEVTAWAGLTVFSSSYMIILEATASIAFRLNSSRILIVLTSQSEIISEFSLFHTWNIGFCILSHPLVVH